MRRCGVDTTCSKCGRNIPKGTANFYYNPRDRSEGKRCDDCSKDVWFNRETGSLDSPNDYQDYSVETTAKFDGKCHVCGMQTRAGVTKIQLCSDGVNWRHTYCRETETVEVIKVPRSIPTVPTVQSAPTVEPPSKPQSTQNGNVPLSPIAQAVWTEIEQLVVKADSQHETPNIGPEILELLEGVRSMQAQLAEQLTKRPTFEITIHDKVNECVRTVVNAHPKTKDVLRIAQCCTFGKRLIPYLHGPAGSGKTTIAMQVAEALNIPFHTISLNRQSTPTVILGFVDAYGKYQSTPYAEAWINGGVILIDEFDNASGNLLTTLNTGWANGVMTFPHGQFKMHADCVLVCAGNTCGRGADRLYNERQQLDAATLDRLTYISVPYDEALETGLAVSQNQNDGMRWTKYVQDVRARAAKNNVRVVVSPRASYRGASLLTAGFTWDETVEMELRKGLDADTWGKIK